MPSKTRRPAARASIPSFIAMDVMRAANAREQAGGNVIHMEIGQPRVGAPKAVRTAAAMALETERLGYTEALGLNNLRQRIAAHYEAQYGVIIPAARVVVTTGSSAGFVLAFLAALDHGDRLATAVPGYPCYRNIATALGLDCVGVPATTQNNFAPGRDELDKAHREKPLGAVLVASPANPTGTLLSPQKLEQIARFCRKNGIWLMSDEIYHGLTYDQPATTALAFDDDAIVINSFSKYYAMTGWRIGWMVLPEVLMAPVERLAQHFFISPPTLAQYAALKAFGAKDELENVRQGYAQNRAFLMKHFEAMNLGPVAPPDGAFYIYADVGRFTYDSVSFAAKMLVETGIAVTPGVDFDPQQGHRFLRFSYAGALAEMKEAMHRLSSWLPAQRRDKSATETQRT